MSSSKFCVTILLPAVFVPTVAVAPDDCPVTVSPTAKSVAPNVPFSEYDIGDVVDNDLPFALVVEPTNFSPLENDPVILLNTIVGAVASVLVSSES